MIKGEKGEVLKMGTELEAEEKPAKMRKNYAKKSLRLKRSGKK